MADMDTPKADWVKILGPTPLPWVLRSPVKQATCLDCPPSRTQTHEENVRKKFALKNREEKSSSWEKSESRGTSVYLYCALVFIHFALDGCGEEGAPESLHLLGPLNSVLWSPSWAISISICSTVELK